LLPENGLLVPPVVYPRYSMSFGPQSKVEQSMFSGRAGGAQNSDESRNKLLRHYWCYSCEEFFKAQEQE
jgi:hypothetical protein